MKQCKKEFHFFSPQLFSITVWNKGLQDYNGPYLVDELAHIQSHRAEMTQLLKELARWFNLPSSLCDEFDFSNGRCSTTFLFSVTVSCLTIDFWNGELWGKLRSALCVRPGRMVGCVCMTVPFMKLFADFWFLFKI